MCPRPAHATSDRRPRRLRTPGAVLLCAALPGLASGQGDAAEVDNPPQQQTAAGFHWQLSGSDGDAGHADRAETWTLDAGPDIDLASAEGESAAQRELDAWVLASQAPGGDTDAPETPDAQFELGPGAPSVQVGGSADRWARSVFSDDAAQLTPFEPGHEVFGWELADGLTFSGVGSRRVITDRDRGFVLSAEAGIRLSPRAGFQLGYEVLQASAGSGSEGLGPESVFARFRLRF